MNMAQPIPIELQAFGETVSTVNVTPYQLLQWRAAIRCEIVGMTHSSGRSLAKHVRELFLLPKSITRAELVEILSDMINQINNASK